MTPQADIMVAAPLDLARRCELEKLLKTMNRPDVPGMADPNNALVPFEQFGKFHFARFVIIDDKTVGDLAHWGVDPIPDYPIYLAFVANWDGSTDSCLTALAGDAAASKGLREIFSFCQDPPGDGDLLTWMKQHSHPATAPYVNWIGRTVAQVRKEACLRVALQEELAKYVQLHPDAGDHVRLVRDHLVEFVRENSKLLPVAEPTPIGWWLRNWLHFAIIPVLLILPWLFAIHDLIRFPWLLVFIVAPFGLLAIGVFIWLLRRAPWTFALLVALGLMLVPFLILYPLWLIPVLAIVVSFLAVLRWYEKNEPDYIPLPTREHDTELANHEDHDVTNQYSLTGFIKPNWFRLALVPPILWLTNYGCRHVYNRSNLARIQTIHFARWVFLDGKRRAFFVSNYDGSHQAYMDDFINKVGWGLNIIFSNFVAYPRTRWFVYDGAMMELRFKNTNRRHQIPTQVWYKAYPGLTAFDLARNTRIREGLQRRWMSEAMIRAWLRDL
ncbi:MAG: hypothetical protein QOF14_1181 [Hyphomicrobiales bacterium]|jgi:hypothetical protein|nr:hypothetical protein [Hyphomicrobiales bacterium]